MSHVCGSKNIFVNTASWFIARNFQSCPCPPGAVYVVCVYYIAGLNEKNIKKNLKNILLQDIKDYWDAF